MTIIEENGEIVIPVSGPESDSTPNASLKQHQDRSGRDARLNTKSDQSGDMGNDDEQEVNRIVDQLQSLQAEFSNYKRRIEKERESMAQYAKGEMALKLLPVLDDLERMINHHQEDGHCSLEAIRLIYANFMKILTSVQLSVVKTFMFMRKRDLYYPILSNRFQ